MLLEGRTHIGPVRKENQDVFRIKQIDEKTSLAIVCDGMGGAASGKEAGEIAANTVYDRITKGYRPEGDINSLKNLMLTAVNAANSIVYSESVRNEEKSGMGTTCVAAVVRDNIACITSVGDSRAYVVNSKGITQITNDHTYVEMLYEQGKITKEEISSHEMRNVITKAIGTESNVEVDYFEIELEPDSVLVLCSDGLSNYCSNELIFNFIYQKVISEAADELIEYVNTHGGKDNITVVLLKN